MCAALSDQGKPVPVSVLIWWVDGGREHRSGHSVPVHNQPPTFQRVAKINWGTTANMHFAK
jgi:hypothetical protein